MRDKVTYQDCRLYQELKQALPYITETQFSILNHSRQYNYSGKKTRIFYHLNTTEIFKDAHENFKSHVKNTVVFQEPRTSVPKQITDIVEDRFETITLKVLDVLM